MLLKGDTFKKLNVSIGQHLVGSAVFYYLVICFHTHVDFLVIILEMQKFSD